MSVLAKKPFIEPTLTEEASLQQITLVSGAEQAELPHHHHH